MLPIKGTQRVELHADERNTKAKATQGQGDQMLFVKNRLCPVKIAQNVIAQNVVTQNVVAQNVVAQNVVAQNVVAQNVVAQNVCTVNFL
jgi:hypothetical protein